MTPQDSRILITDQDDVITYQDYWYQNLVVANCDHLTTKSKVSETLKDFLQRYQARVVWTSSAGQDLGIFVPNPQNLTMFMLINADLYSYKQTVWENDSVAYEQQLISEIEEANEYMERVLERYDVYQSLGPVEFHRFQRHGLVKPVHSSKLLGLLKKIRVLHSPVAKTP